MNKDTLWFEFIHNIIPTETIFPPILRLKLDKTNLAFETGVHGIAKEYSSKIIEFLTNLRPKGRGN